MLEKAPIEWSFSPASEVDVESFDLPVCIGCLAEGRASHCDYACAGDASLKKGSSSCGFFSSMKSMSCK